jgi:hypothetical protein
MLIWMEYGECYCVPQGAPKGVPIAAWPPMTGHEFRDRGGPGVVIVCLTCGGQCQPDPNVHLAYVQRFMLRGT